MWSLKAPFGGDKLPVRGRIRCEMVILAGAMMLNLRRIHRWRLEEGLPIVFFAMWQDSVHLLLRWWMLRSILLAMTPKTIHRK
jgi:hypothetical protein